MTDAGSEGFRLDQEGIAIAIGCDGLEKKEVAGAFALGPKLLARAAEKRDVARGERLVERFAIHVANHEDTFGISVLDNGRYQAILLVKIEKFAHSAIRRK